MNQVLLLSGPPGAGKTTVAEAVCERYDRMLRVEVDTLRHWVCAGYRHPWAGDAQAEQQLQLARANASAIARETVRARYAVVIDDVAFGADLKEYGELLRDSGAFVEAVTLLPDLETTLARGAARPDGVGAERIRELHERFTAEAAASAIPGAILDTTGDADAYVTADRMMDAIAAGDAVLVRPEPT